jgi:hypothetical protein
MARAGGSHTLLDLEWVRSGPHLAHSGFSVLALSSWELSGTAVAVTDLHTTDLETEDQPDVPTGSAEVQLTTTD